MMMVARLNMIIMLVLFSCLTNLGLLASISENGENYVQDACSVTRYHDICIRSLSPFSNTAKRSPSKWARAGVSVTLTEAKGVSQYLINLKKQRTMTGRNRIALSDCIECVQDAIDNLHKTLAVLRNLNGRTFDTQMSDVNTWMSAALTDEETCLDGFDSRKRKQVKSLRKQVLNVSYITSNALALCNKLASTGAQGIIL